MAEIKDWENTAAGNDQGTPPDYAPENATPIPSVNNIIRELQAAVRLNYEEPGWRDLGDAVTHISADTFEVPGNQTAYYFVGQRVKVTDGGGTVYGTVSAVTVPANTQVEVAVDASGVLTSPITSVEVGPVLYDKNTTGAEDMHVLVGDGVGNLKDSDREINDSYTPELDTPPSPDTSLNVATMRALEDALRTTQAGATDSFTPNIYTDTHAGGSVTYASQTGSIYTVGDLVFVNVYITITNASNVPDDNEQIKIGGIPAGFECYDPNSRQQTVGMVYEYNFTSGATSGVPDGGVCAVIDSGDNYFTLKQPSRSGNGSMINVVGGAIKDDTHIRFSGVYRRAAA